MSDEIFRPENEIDNPTEETNTSCKDCVFSIKENDTQVGCEFNKVELYKNKGVEVIEAFDGEDNEFYVIKAWCSTYREELWKVAHKDEDIYKQIDDETYPKVTYVIILDDFNEYDFQKTINSIQKQKFPARRLIVTCTNPEIYMKVLTSIKGQLEELHNSNFRVHCIKSGMSFESALDQSFQLAVNGFFMGLECGDEVPEDAIAIMHYAMNKQLKSIGLIKNGNEVSGSMHQATLYKFLYGYRGASFETKLIEGEEYDKTTDSNSLITSWDKLRCLYQESQS
tara:strand:- start:1463 stop:2308 length:846 start_codon:yes stop_codon:yes gene_type:complete